jgi:hypothetical protein
MMNAFAFPQIRKRLPISTRYHRSGSKKEAEREKEKLEQASKIGY